jgi:hypothetical protein
MSDRITKEDLALLEEIKKNPHLYGMLLIEPEYILRKMYQVLRAFYS